MESKVNVARFAVTKDIASSVYENDVLRDGSAELERARSEFRLGHLQVAARLLDELAFRLKPRLSSADCLELAATYAASRVLDARIHEQQKQTGERDKALAEGMEVYDRISGSLESLPTRAVGDYGIALEMLGRHEEAAVWLQKALEKGLDTQSTFHYLGLAQKALKKHSDAAQTLREAEKRDPEDAIAVAALGDVLAAGGDQEGAAEAYWRASVANLKTNQLEEALKLVDASGSLRLENAKDLGLRGAILWKLGRNEEALQLLDRAIAVAPPKMMVMGQNLLTGIWRVKGRILLQLERWKDAVDAFEKTVVQDPDNTLSLAGQAKALMHLGRWNDALPLLDRALAREPKNIGVIVDKAIVLGNLAQPEEALKLITQQGLRLDADSIPALDVCGRLLRERKKFKAAAMSFRRITELDPSRLDAWLNTADTLRRSGQMQEALQALNEAASHFENASPAEAAQLQSAFGRVLRDQGKLAEALEKFDQSYNITPELPEFMDFVDTLRQLQKYERAFAVAEAYLARHIPAPIEALIQKARLLCEVGEFGQAYKILRPIEDKNASVFALRGWALENQGQQFAQKALAEFEQAAALEPANLWYKNHVASALRLVGRGEEAKTIYREIVGELNARGASLNAYDLWLLGWCHLCLNHSGEAIRYLTVVPAAETAAFPQFDLALAYLCDGRPGLAKGTYESAIRQLNQKNQMRLRSLLTVTIRDLEVAKRLGLIRPELRQVYGDILSLLHKHLKDTPLYAYQKAS